MAMSVIAAHSNFSGAVYNGIIDFVGTWNV